jgi:hypothetical protein
MKKSSGTPKSTKPAGRKVAEYRSSGDLKTKLQTNPDRIRGIGPLLVGNPIEPEEVGIIAIYRSEKSPAKSYRDLGFRLNISRNALYAFVVAGIIAVALVCNDRDLLTRGLQLLQGLAISPSSSRHVPGSP